MTKYTSAPQNAILAFRATNEHRNDMFQITQGFMEEWIAVWNSFGNKMNEQVRLWKYKPFADLSVLVLDEVSVRMFAILEQHFVNWPEYDDFLIFVDKLKVGEETYAALATDKNRYNEIISGLTGTLVRAEITKQTNPDIDETLMDETLAAFSILQIETEDLLSEYARKVAEMFEENLIFYPFLPSHNPIFKVLPDIVASIGFFLETMRKKIDERMLHLLSISLRLFVTKAHEPFLSGGEIKLSIKGPQINVTVDGGFAAGMNEKQSNSNINMDNATLQVPESPPIESNRKLDELSPKEQREGALDIWENGLGADGVATLNLMDLETVIEKAGIDPLDVAEKNDIPVEEAADGRHSQQEIYQAALDQLNKTGRGIGTLLYNAGYDPYDVIAKYGIPALLSSLGIPLPVAVVMGKLGGAGLKMLKVFGEEPENFDGEAEKKEDWFDRLTDPALMHGVSEIIGNLPEDNSYSEGDTIFTPSSTYYQSSGSDNAQNSNLQNEERNPQSLRTNIESNQAPMQKQVQNKIDETMQAERVHQPVGEYPFPTGSVHSYGTIKSNEFKEPIHTSSKASHKNDNLKTATEVHSKPANHSMDSNPNKGEYVSDQSGNRKNYGNENNDPISREKNKDVPDYVSTVKTSAQSDRKTHSVNGEIFSQKNNQINATHSQMQHDLENKNANIFNGHETDMSSATTSPIAGNDLYRPQIAFRPEHRAIVPNSRISDLMDAKHVFPRSVFEKVKADKLLSDIPSVLNSIHTKKPKDSEMADLYNDIAGSDGPFKMTANPTTEQAAQLQDIFRSVKQPQNANELPSYADCIKRNAALTSNGYPVSSDGIALFADKGKQLKPVIDQEVERVSVSPEIASKIVQAQEVYSGNASGWGLFFGLLLLAVPIGAVLIPTTGGFAIPASGAILVLVMKQCGLDLMQSRSLLGLSSTLGAERTKSLVQNYDVVEDGESFVLKRNNGMISTDIPNMKEKLNHYSL